jgi:hypothetical protein
MSYSSKFKNQDTNNNININININTNNIRNTPFNTNNTEKINDIDIKSKEQQFIDEYSYKKKLKEDKQNRYKHNIEKTYNLQINNNIDNTDTALYNPNFCIQPRHINIYNKKYCMKWLTYNLNENYYHYDYCVRLFELLMKWVRYNNFSLKTNERVLLGKFISLMYLLSNKKEYSYDK